MENRLIYKLLIATLKQAVTSYYAGGTLIIDYLGDLYLININGEKYSVVGIFEEYNKPARPLSLLESSIAFALYKWKRGETDYFKEMYEKSLLSQCSNDTKRQGIQIVEHYTNGT